MKQQRARAQSPGTSPKGRLQVPVAEVTDGAAVLAQIETFLQRFVAYPDEHCRVAHVLWLAHAHCMDAWDSTPRLAFLSPEPGSGKTRALEVSELLVPRAVSAVNATPAYLFRKVSDPEGRPTILFDEIDTLFGPKAKEHEEVRGILNAGHRKGAMAGRCVIHGKSVETEELPAYCAVAVAGLGNLPDTILTRSVIVRMRRRAPSEKVEPYRHRVHSAEGYALRERLAAWIEPQTDVFSGEYPAMPPGVEDRAADVWEALLAVADRAGGAWPVRARTAAVALVTASRDQSPSLGVRLLADLRTVFAAQEAMHTDAILAALHALEEAPWADLKGKPLDPRGMSRLLKPYDVGAKVVRIGFRVARGLQRSDLHDAWSRYLPPLDGAGSVTSVTPVTSQSGEVLAGYPPRAAVTDVTGVTLAGGPTGQVDGVPVAVPRCGGCLNYKSISPGTGECRELGWQVNEDDEFACPEFLAINPARAAG